VDGASEAAKKTDGNVATYVLLALLLWRGPIGIPRGLYHLAFPRAYDRWKVRHEFEATLVAHRRECSRCRASPLSSTPVTSMPRECSPHSSASRR